MVVKVCLQFLNVEINIWKAIVFFSSTTKFPKKFTCGMYTFSDITTIYFSLRVTKRIGFIRHIRLIHYFWRVVMKFSTQCFKLVRPSNPLLKWAEGRAERILPANFLLDFFLFEIKTILMWSLTDLLLKLPQFLQTLIFIFHITTIT